MSALAPMFTDAPSHPKPISLLVWSTRRYVKAHFRHSYKPGASTDEGCLVQMYTFLTSTVTREE